MHVFLWYMYKTWANKANEWMNLWNWVVVLEMGPDPNWAYFWPAIRGGSGTFRPDPKGKNWKFWYFRWHFLNPNQKWLTRPDPSNKKLTRTNTGQIFFTQTHQCFRSSGFSRQAILPIIILGIGNIFQLWPLKISYS